MKPIGGFRRDREGALEVLAPLLARQSNLWCGLPLPCQCGHIARKACEARQLPCQYGGLIVAASAKPLWVQRDRYQEVGIGQEVSCGLT